VEVDLLNRGAGPSYDTKTVTLSGRGRRPLSPVHVSGATDSGTGDVTISWVRRTRIGGDSWDQVEMPLGEDSEAYEVDILDPAGAVLRTLTSAAPSALYTAAEQTADFGAPQAAYTVRIHQISQFYGRGTGREATIDV